MHASPKTGALPGLGWQLIQCLVLGMGSAHLQSCLWAPSHLRFSGKNLLSAGPMTARVTQHILRPFCWQERLPSGLCPEGGEFIICLSSGFIIITNPQDPSPVLLIYYPPFILGPNSCSHSSLIRSWASILLCLDVPSCICVKHMGLHGYVS